MVESVLFSHVNNTSQYQMVANYHVVLGSYENLGDAQEELALLDEDALQWASIEIVEPGGKIEGRLERGLTQEEIHPASGPLTDFFENYFEKSE